MEHDTNPSFSFADRVMLMGGVLALLVMLVVAIKPKAAHEQTHAGPMGSTSTPGAHAATGEASSAASAANAAALKAMMDQGEQLYHVCAICHGMTGEGMPGQYPPLKNAPYVIGSPDRLARIMIHGLEGPTIVHGVEYDMPMPAPPLNDDNEIAAVMTFIRKSFGNRASAVTPEFVTKIQEETKGRETSWTARELDEIP